MKKLYALIFITSIALIVKAQEYKIMTYNIRLSLESDGDNAWSKRKEEVLGLFQYYHPDVFGVQEAVPQQMEDIRTLKDYQSVGVGRDDGANQGEFSAIFYDKSKFSLLKSSTFWLSETPDKPSKGWDAAYNRVCTYALLEDKKLKKSFLVFNTHFDHIGNEARKNAAKLILEKIQSLNTKSFPIIVMGDLNLTDDTEPVKILSQNLTDTYYHSIKPHYGPKGTFQGFDVNTIPKDRIDYIFVKNFETLSNRTINDRRENLLYPSDHFPVLVKLKIK